MKIELKTKDKVKIVGEFNEPESAKKAIVLLHMMPATKESWIDFAVKLNASGFATLAIDERGHGQSQGGPSGYQSFTPVEQQAKIHDVEAAVEFLQGKGLPPTAIAGASIGANLALAYQAEHPEIVSTIPMSAGLNYLGVDAQAAVKRLKQNQRVYFVSSTQDERVAGAAEMAKQLHQQCTAGEKQIFISNSTKHGSDIFAVEPELEEKLVNWLQ